MQHIVPVFAMNLR